MKKFLKYVLLILYLFLTLIFIITRVPDIDPFLPVIPLDTVNKNTEKNTSKELKS